MKKTTLSSVSKDTTTEFAENMTVENQETIMEFPKNITVGNEEVQRTYVLKPRLLLVEFRQDIPPEEIKEILTSLGARQIPQKLLPGEKLPPRLQYRQHQWISLSETTLAREDFTQLEAVEQVAPVYFEEQSSLLSAAAPRSNLILIHEENLANLPEYLQERAFEQRLDPLGLLYGIGYYAIPIHDWDDYNVFQLRQEFTGVEFDWTMLAADNGNGETETLSSQQWNMKRIKAQGADLSGWDLSKGDPDVWIAVLDSGFDLDHHDLAFTPFNTHLNAAQIGGPHQHNASYVRTHGTAVAGVTAALFNHIGVAGVAGSCPILPIYHGDTTEGLVYSILWSAVHGARVINISGRFVGEPILREAVKYAVNTNAVLVAAAGNGGNQQITVPAAYSEVIAVGSINKQNQKRASSNWGKGLDVVAPGVEITTTDLLGEFGRNDGNQGSDGDYFSTFAGTSAASPHVAGLAALLFSYCPELNNQEVRDAIESTCQKISPNRYVYESRADRPNGDWNPHTGYGLINVLAALQSCGSPDN